MKAAPHNGGQTLEQDLGIAILGDIQTLLGCCTEQPDLRWPCFQQEFGAPCTLTYSAFKCLLVSEFDLG